MGKTMSTVSGHLKRAFYRYNAENRALKYIEKEKLPVAPRHEKTEILLEGIKKENAAAFEKLLKKDENLDKYLKDVYLTSTGQNEEIKVKKALPENRISRSEYVFIEPVEVPKGHCVLSKIVTFLDDNRRDPQLWSATKISKEYQLEKEKVDKLLKYFGTFVLYGYEEHKQPGTIDLSVTTNIKQALEEKKLLSTEKVQKPLKELDESLHETKNDKTSETEESSQLKKIEDEIPSKARSVSK